MLCGFLCIEKNDLKMKKQIYSADLTSLRRVGSCGAYKIPIFRAIKAE
jgi:hypothetical protein